MSPWAATQQVGPYVLLAPLGSGGMGEVWKARDTRLGRTVAIKRLKSAHSERFQQEARSIAALNHPHICQIHDVGPDYLVLEYIEGRPLRGPLPAEQAIRLALEIASALEEAHDHGILHRDLKPGNILVTPKGAAKLLDFGLAKLNAQTDSDDTVTIEGTVLGTTAYMSPEQATGQPVDARSDIFSFGAVLYELLSGARAFSRASTAEVLSAVLRDEPPPLSTTAALERILRRCLSKVPEQRFQSVAELRAALASASATAADEKPSVAVLPFADMSPAKDHEWFGDGLAEEILNALAKISGLKVIARTSAFAFKGKNEDIRRIAETLGVAHILEGSVRKAGNRVRVTAQLITAADGSHLWSERYDRDMDDVFAIQDEIATAIAGALQVKLAVAPRAYIPKPEAYQELLKARHHLQKWTPNSAALGRQCLERAVALDPSFAQARCELGSVFFNLVTVNHLLPPEGAAFMRTEAEQALKADPKLAEANALLGMAAVLDYAWTEAGRRFETAFAADRIQPATRSIYSRFYLAPIGRMKEAQEQMDLVLKEDPLNLLSRAFSASYLLASGRASEGEVALRQVLELDPNFWLAYNWIAWLRIQQNRFNEALVEAQKACALAPWNGAVRGLLAGVLERRPPSERSRELLEKLGDGSAFGAPAGWLAYYFVRGDIDKAVGWYEKAIEQRDTRAPWIFDAMAAGQFRQSSHWPRLARLMNLPD